VVASELQETFRIPTMKEEERCDLLTGVAGLPARFYHDNKIFELEFEKFFSKMWLFVGREEDVPEVGNYFVREVAGSSFFVIKTETGAVKGFHNFCRHRCAKLLRDTEGTRRIIQCPYHAWSYSLDGRLVSAPNMDSLNRFDPVDYGLVPLQVESWKGFLFACLNHPSTPLFEAHREFFELCRHLPLEELRRGARLEYQVNANWKIIAENYSECYHCPPVHPSLNRITPYYTASGSITRLDWENGCANACGYMSFAEGYNSMTVTGYTNRPPIRGTKSEDTRRIYYTLFFPNMFFSLHPDYLMVHALWPVDSDTTRVVCEFYFEPAVLSKASCNPKDAVEIWNEINKQDWSVCELAHQGTSSKFAVQGPYAKNERRVRDFDVFLAKGLGLL
jgi:Rieske 2Fe-2S family protein